jgi:hypothetical protein
MQADQFLIGGKADLERLFKEFVGCHNSMDGRKLNIYHITPETQMAREDQKINTVKSISKFIAFGALIIASLPLLLGGGTFLWC